MMRAVLVISVALVVAAGAQAPLLRSARQDSQAVTLLSRDVAALASRATDPTWVAWQVPMIDGERSLCCTYVDHNAPYGIRGCWMEPSNEDGPPTPAQVQAPAGPVQLEAGTKVAVFVRLVDHRSSRPSPAN